MSTVATNEDWESELAASLPKIELHLHLDGSLSPGKTCYAWGKGLILGRQGQIIDDILGINQTFTRTLQMDLSSAPDPVRKKDLDPAKDPLFKMDLYLVKIRSDPPPIYMQILY